MAIIAGIGFAFLSGCFEAMMYDSLKRANQADDMQKVSGLNEALAQLAIIVGSFCGGFLALDLQLESFLLLILLTSCSVAAAMVVSFFLKEPATAYKHSENNGLTLLKDGIQLLKTHKALQRIMLLSVLVTPFINYHT